MSSPAPTSRTPEAARGSRASSASANGRARARDNTRHEARTGRRAKTRAKARGKVGEQLEMQVVKDAGANASPKTWGGARSGAGAKRRGTTKVAHRRRPEHKHRNPVHVTVRARQGLPSFRTQRIYAMLFGVLTRQKERAYKDDFQVVEFSIQTNHVHVIVEATDKRSLRAGTSGLVIAFALRLNKLLQRAKGKVWAERYHAHALTTPREVKNALSYLFHNWKKHGMTVRGAIVDHLSSAPAFRGWAVPVVSLAERDGLVPWATPDLRTWMLRVGWHLRHGLLFPFDAPAARARVTRAR